MSLLIEYYSNDPMDENASVKIALSCFDWNQFDMIRVTPQQYDISIDTTKIKNDSKIFYKFVVNGNWKLSDDTSINTEADPNGNINHVLTVSDELTPSPPSTTNSKQDDSSNVESGDSTLIESTLRKRSGLRRNSNSSTTSTVMVLYNQQNPYAKFLRWFYNSTFGQIINVIKFVFGSRNSS